jgi:hypothetical protein
MTFSGCRQSPDVNFLPFGREFVVGTLTFFVIFLKIKEDTAKLSLNLSTAWTKLSSDVCFYNSA